MQSDKLLHIENYCDILFANAHISFCTLNEPQEVIGLQVTYCALCKFPACFQKVHIVLGGGARTEAPSGSCAVVNFSQLGAGVCLEGTTAECGPLHW